MMLKVVVEGPAVVSSLTVCVLWVARPPRTHRKSTTCRSRLTILLLHSPSKMLSWAQKWMLEVANDDDNRCSEKEQ